MDDPDNISSGIVECVRTNDRDDNTHRNSTENSISQIHDDQDHLKRNLICFWVIGLCYGIGYNILSSASFDIIKRLEGPPDNFTKVNVSNNTRDCIADLPTVSLLANNIPALTLKFILPFIPFYAKTNMISSCILATASFVIVASSQYKWQAILGNILMSIATNLNDVTSLAYMAKFKDRKKIIISYSGGGGVSGVSASFFYAALCDIGLTPTITLFMMLVVPLMGLIAFFFIKESTIANSPPLLGDDVDEIDSHTTEAPTLSLSEKLRYMPKLTKYFFPMLINCLLEYTISQTFDLLYVPAIWLSHADQFRWISVICNIGSLIGRLMLSYIWLEDIWSLNLLIGTFMSYFLFESIFMTIPNIWVIFIFVFLVEIISDYTMINIYFRISNETPQHFQVIAMCSISIGITIGEICAGAFIIPIHSIICKLPPPLEIP